MRARPISCCFSGYRPEKLPWGDDESDLRCVALKRRLRHAIEAACDEGYRHFICGMASGVDLYCCEIALELRKTRPITVEAAVPYPGQAEDWPPDQRARYRALVAACDDETVVSEAYAPGCMQRRNRYMVDNSALLLACSNGRPGGTMNTLLYALEKQVKFLTIEIED